MTTNKQLVDAALGAATLDAALAVHELLRGKLGTHERPLGDRWNNHGLMGQSGSFDLKLIEQITNMQDGVLEKLALKKFGDSAAVPYVNPHEAANDLLADAPDKDRAVLATVTFIESDGNPGRSKRLTPVFRDRGCGLEPAQVPATIFRLGGQLKEDRLWQQGAFGLGGATTFRNAKAVVLVTRRDPALLEAGSPDLITVAVVLWKERTKGTAAYYLVTEDGDHGVPWSCPASDYPDFAPGTHLALISYGTEGIQRKRQGDERAFDTVANTRLFRPVLPIMFRNETDRGRPTIIRGLYDRLADRSGNDIPSSTLTIPFRVAGQVHDLPVTYFLFATKGEAGERRSFVAHDHVVAFTSNGQVHHHWNAPTFRAKTKLNKLADRVLVVVETDQLPIRVRTRLFTADRADLVRTDAAVQLEDDVAAALDSWEDLKEQNDKLIREALKGSDQPTRDVAKRISRALDLRGFRPDTGTGAGGGGGGNASGGGSNSGKPRVVELLPDPTYVSGPVTRTVEIGKTTFITVYVNVVDEFWTRGRGQLETESDHDEIGPDQMRVGGGGNGRVPVVVSVPETAQPGTEELRVTLSDWHRSAGGLGPTLTHTIKLELVENLPGRGSGNGKAGAGNQGSGGPGQGNLVALRWSTTSENSDWKPITVGEVMPVAASTLAQDEDYAELASLGDQTIPTVVLNRDYPPLQDYLRSRSKKIEGLGRPLDQYATGVGLHLLLIDQEVTKRQKKEEQSVDDSFVEVAHQAAARAVLSVMPAADTIAKEMGMDD